MSTRNCRSTRASAEVVVVTEAVVETVEVVLEAVEAAIVARSETMPRVDVETISVEMAMIAGRSLAAGMTTAEVLGRRVVVVVWTAVSNRVARLAPVVAAIVDSGLEELRDWEGSAVATAAASAL
uniref:(northern house mosquito) hypothetical protein n=1 Tax=Culex pipiens TaxID=7175 RepID=A0A8D8G805_CULPI